MMARALTAAGKGDRAYWIETGRPLTAWEQRMRLTRADVWLPVGDAVYRFALPYTQAIELERVAGYGVGAMWGKLPAEHSLSLKSRMPSDHAVHLIRLALIGGGIGIRAGNMFAITPVLAQQVVEPLATGPLSGVWSIARAVLTVVLLGREATPEEQAAFSIPEAPPLPPAWALEFTA